MCRSTDKCQGKDLRITYSSSLMMMTSSSLLLMASGLHDAVSLPGDNRFLLCPGVVHAVLDVCLFKTSWMVCWPGNSPYLLRAVCGFFVIEASFPGAPKMSTLLTPMNIEIHNSSLYRFACRLTRGVLVQSINIDNYKFKVGCAYDVW